MRAARVAQSLVLGLLVAGTRASATGTFWSSDGTGDVSATSSPERGAVTRCAYQGMGNWTYQYGASALPVAALDVLAYGADLRVVSTEPGAEVFLCLTLLGAGGRVVNGLYAPLNPPYTRSGLSRVEGRCVVPPGAASARLTLWGTRGATVDTDRAVLRPAGSVASRVAPSARETLTVEGGSLSVVVDARDGSLSVRDRRGGRTWQTFGLGPEIAVLGASRPSPTVALLRCLYLPADEPLEVRFEVARDAPEVLVRTSMAAGTPMPSWAAQVESVPALCSPSPTTELVVPYGEGFLYPTADPALPAQLMQAGDGAGLTMPWYGVWDRTDGAAAMCMLTTDNDALGHLYYRVEGGRSAGQLSLRWMSEMGRWGYDREARYWFAAEGGYVALCKRYRQEARRRGLLVTLDEKAGRNPSIRRLLGAPDIWFPFLWHRQDRDSRMEPARWLHEHGITRAIFGTADALPSTDEMVAWGWFPTQYDVYSDVWRPEDHVAGVFQRGFDERDLRLDRTGQPVRGWVQVTAEGAFPGYNLCPTRHPAWAARYVAPSLRERTMLGRFIDTTTALPLGECYNPRHPMSRTRDREARLQLLRYAASRGLVVGSEIGVHWGVPVLAYSEGMLSPVGYRHPDAGRLTPDLEPVAATEAYVLNPRARVPLWELVFHDCQIATWYWGDANNTFPAAWPRRNAFNALYALPPIYMVLEDEAVYLAQRDAMVRTDEYLRPLWPVIGFSEMVSHEFLTEDRMLQATDFATGARIVANFASDARDYDGRTVPPLGYLLLEAEEVTAAPSAIAAPPSR